MPTNVERLLHDPRYTQEADPRRKAMYMSRARQLDGVGQPSAVERLRTDPRFTMETDPQRKAEYLLRAGEMDQPITLTPDAMPAMPDPSGALLSAATPTDIAGAKGLPPWPTQPGTWGQTALRYGLPIAFGALAGTPGAGLGAGLGSFLAEAPLVPPNPQTDPIGAAQVQAAAPRAARIGLETFGAGAGSKLIPGAQVGAGFLDRAGRLFGRVLGAGAGAGAGSLAAEPIQPSPSPVQQAGKVAGGAATGQVLGEGVAGFGAKVLAPFAKSLTREGRQAAETLAEAGEIVPMSTSRSRLLKTAEFLGEESFGGGTLMSKRNIGAQERMTERINAVVDEAKIPPTSDAADALKRAGSVRAMYQELDNLVSQGLARPTRPVALSPDIAGQAQTVSQGVPQNHQLQPVLQHLQRVKVMSQQSAQREHDALADYLRTAGQGMAPPIRQSLEQLTRQMETSIQSPAIVNMQPLVPRLEAWAHTVAPYLPPEAGQVIRRVQQVPTHLSFQEAQELRSTLLAIGRSVEGAGAQRAPSAGGVSPLAGSGGRFAATTGGQARDLAKAVDAAMEAGANDLGPDVAQLWRHSNEARRVAGRSEWLQRILTRPAVLDPQTGLYNGNALLRAFAQIQSRNRDDFADLFPSGTIANIRQFANALGHLQESEGGSSRSFAHMLLHRGVSLTQALGGASAAVPGPHQGIGAGVMITPTALGLILQSPRLTRWLTLGLKAPEGSREATAAMGRLLGVLNAEGLIQESPQTLTPAPNVSYGAPAQTQGGTTR